MDSEEKKNEGDAKSLILSLYEPTIIERKCESLVAIMIFQQKGKICPNIVNIG